MFELVDSIHDSPVIKLIGMGGGGSNAVQHMVSCGIEGVDFICANTDAQALKSMEAQTVLHIGQSITKGLGAGANPEIGRQAAMEDRDRIQDLIQGTDMLFITAGMGGGTGTGAIPVVAQIARELGVLTVAVVTKPFPFEGAKRMRVAEAGIEELRGHVDSLITIPNEKLLSVLGKNISLLDAFRAANDVLRGAVSGIAELMTNPGLINVDFADVRTVMSEMGLAMMGSGIGHGDERATEAAEMAISSPLLEDIDLAGARGILVNITAGTDMAIGEFEEVGNVVRQFAADDATVVVGTAIDENLEGELRVTVVATGLNPPERSQLRSVAGASQGRGGNANPQRGGRGYPGNQGGGQGGNQGGMQGSGYAPSGFGRSSGQGNGLGGGQGGGQPGGGHGGGYQGGHGGQGNQGGNQGGHGNQGGSRYDSYERPTVIRKSARGNAQPPAQGNFRDDDRDQNGQDVEYLDIPAFLRRQAD